MIENLLPRPVRLISAMFGLGNPLHLLVVASPSLSLLLEGATNSIAVASHASFRAAAHSATEVAAQPHADSQHLAAAQKDGIAHGAWVAQEPLDESDDGEVLVAEAFPTVEDQEDADVDEDVREEDHDEPSEFDELEQAVVETRGALAVNEVNLDKVAAELANLTNEAASEEEIKSAETTAAGETNSPVFAKYVGDMWRELRTYEEPMYEEHLRGQQDAFKEPHHKLEKSYETAKDDLTSYSKAHDMAITDAYDDADADDDADENVREANYDDAAYAQ